MSDPIIIRTNALFEHEYRDKVTRILRTTPFNRGAAHAMKDDTTASTHELANVREAFEVGANVGAWAEVVQPNRPWANDHFEERVSGKPLNPAPSEAWWPFARAGNSEHKKDEIFSHTYPERFWPKYAGEFEARIGARTNFTHSTINRGIRFPYGDLSNLVGVLRKNPNSRQAYLPIWFPEDLTAADMGERVPCSMGYHFITDPGSNNLDCVYTMRSCDLVRFYRDDIYMAGRLLQWVGEQTDLYPGHLTINIANLHCFPGDAPYLNTLLPKFHIDPRQQGRFPEDPRKAYNLDAL